MNKRRLAQEWIQGLRFIRCAAAKKNVANSIKRKKGGPIAKGNVKKAGMRVAIEGCCHGELDNIYATMQQLEKQQDKKIDLLICCGDFQAVRNLDDLECLACPPKYRDIRTFHKYYSVGGNHEACNYLWELYYGGWAAPQIYYLGHAGVVNFGGVRIGGMSGTYQSHHYNLGHFERAPYNNSTLRSAYHVRELEAYRLKQLRQPVDIMLSHDWPDGIAYHGDIAQLLRCKPFLKTDIERGEIGNPPAMQIMQEVKPKYWFSAHHHVKYAALVRHKDQQPKKAPDHTVDKLAEMMTSFLALDKCLPGRRFLQVIDFPDATGPKEFSYDKEWLAVLKNTHNLLSLDRRAKPLPGMGGFRGEASEEALTFVDEIFKKRGGPKIPQNFQPTAPAHKPSQTRGSMPRLMHRNPQTEALLDMLQLQYNLESSNPVAPPTEANPEEIDISLEDLEGSDLEDGSILDETNLQP